MHDWLEILPTPLPTAAAIAFVSTPDAGGVAVFLGTTPQRNHPPPATPSLALDYEAYPEIATRQLADLATSGPRNAGPSSSSPSSTAPAASPSASPPS